MRTPQPDALLAALAPRPAARCATTADGVVVARAWPPDQVGDLAFENGIRLHELAPAQASLEQAFMELTAASVEFRAGGAGRGAGRGTGRSRGHGRGGLR